ncbi:MAG: 1-acyl-sn-glycerol-3-phosphate acyltransferase [Leptospiraceae bacterium]|nr:1-acyl-sn-glycerol-3-phosphate acyltransferase [Leptospiraceae bacterium]
MKSAFIAPEFNLPLAWAIDFSLPVILKSALNLDGIEITSQDRELLRGLRDERVLYMGNHPTMVEPPVAYHTANVMGSRFHYMASRTVFDWYMGILGEVIKRVGAFSVVGGGGSREAMKYSREILSGPGGKLAIYPEGMMSGENDNLVPFMSGTAQIGFWALEDARKKHGNAADIVVLPAFTKYLSTLTPEQARRDIEMSLTRIERKLGIDPGDRNLLRQFLTVGRVLLEKYEQEYHIPRASETDYEYRVGRLRHAVLEKAASILGMQLDSHADAFTKIRDLWNAVEAAEAGFPLARRDLSAAQIAEARTHLNRAYMFIVIRREYLLEHPSPERFYEWLTRYENFILGHSRMRPRRARVFIGEPFYIGKYYGVYQENRRKGLEQVTQRLRSEMEKQLDKGIRLTRTLVTPHDIGE